MTSPMEELTFVFARLKVVLLAEGKAGRVVEDLAEAVKKSIPGPPGAGVSLMDDQGRRRRTASSPRSSPAAAPRQRAAGQRARGGEQGPAGCARYA
ncbi:hypothetical protein ACX80H_00965 [Arthrobacter sp. MDT2-2]